ncbi:MAG: DUF1573 domain-containing protein [Verrucomicrobiota bacterium]
MISWMKREWLALLLPAVLLIGFAGCTGPKSKPVVVEKPAPVAPPVANTPPVEPAPLPVVRPRPAADASDNMADHILQWDSVTKTYNAAVGQTNAPFTFAVTNVSAERVLIYDISTTCECTLAQLPSRPWPLAPGNGGVIQATLDLSGRTGAVTNYLIVFTSKGNRLLTVRGVPAFR